MLRRTLSLLAGLTACGERTIVEVPVNVFTLSLEPVVPEGQDPFTGAELTLALRSAGGERQIALGPSEDATWSVDALDALDDTRIGLLVTEPGATTDPLDWADLRAYGETPPVTLADGDTTVTLLVPGYARVGALGALTGSQVSFGAAAAWLPDGEVWLFGGAPSVFGASPPEASRQILRLAVDDDRFDFERAGDIPSLPGSPPERVAATATVVTHEGIPQILVVGGRPAWTPANAARSRAFLWDPVARAASWDGPAPEDRSQHIAIARPDGSVLLLGGYDGQGLAGALTWDAWRPGDPPSFQAGGEIEGLGDIGFGAAAVPDGVVLCGGGGQFSVPSSLDPTFTCRLLRDDGTTALLPDIAAGPGQPAAARMWHAMALTGTGKVLLTGGIAAPVAAGGTREATAEAWLLDPTPGDATWEFAGVMNHPRAMHRALSLPDGRVLLLGGVEAGVGAAPNQIGDVVDCPEIFDPADNTFTLLAGCPTSGIGALAPLATSPGRGAFVLAGFHALGGGEDFGVIGLGPAPP